MHPLVDKEALGEEWDPTPEGFQRIVVQP